ncbi:hypothetical protein OG342_35290 [Streptomyces bobili]|uniref:hypothetical protein n=1 Tax=Streptomyces bobili TaxID=67280 RepID=UPI00225726F7|nr:hypothetical protein [Streptomyces bobili]MCX5528065.1 hypothetical protein [Streptomyces bobili]
MVTDLLDIFRSIGSTAGIPTTGGIVAFAAGDAVSLLGHLADPHLPSCGRKAAGVPICTSSE